MKLREGLSLASAFLLLLLAGCSGGGGGGGASVSTTVSQQGGSSSGGGGVATPSVRNLKGYHADAGSHESSECVACHGQVVQNGDVHLVHLDQVDLTCTYCHTRVDLEQGSGANLRRQVSVELCATCHSGGAMQWYLPANN